MMVMPSATGRAHLLTVGLPRAWLGVACTGARLLTMPSSTSKLGSAA